MIPERSRVVWWNGQFVPEADARLSIYDSALMFGDMVFEMTRSFGKVQFKLREHLERLSQSAKAVELPLPFSFTELEAAAQQTIQANESLCTADDEHRLMINVTRGLLSIYEGVVGVPKGPQVIMADFPLRWTVAGMGELFDAGIHAVIPSQRAIPASLLDPKVKHRSRLHYFKANLEVSRWQGSHNWALLLDPNGFITEGTGSNFFLVKGRQLITPLGQNVLRGISRHYVMEELARQLELRVAEDQLESYDVLQADEAFMTATPFCLLPVTQLNGQPIGAGTPGPVTQALLAQWSRNVGIDIVEQIKQWDRVRTTPPAAGVSPYVFGTAR